MIFSGEEKKYPFHSQDYDHIGGAGMVEWHSPPTNVTRVRFREDSGHSGVPGCSGVPVFRCVPGCSGVRVFRCSGVPGCSGVPVFRGVPGCSGVPGFSTCRIKITGKEKSFLKENTKCMCINFFI